MPEEIKDHKSPIGVEMEIGGHGTFQLPENTIDRLKAMAEQIKSDPNTIEYRKKDGQAIYVHENKEDGLVTIVDSNGLEILPRVAKPNIIFRRIQLGLQQRLWTRVEK